MFAFEECDVSRLLVNVKNFRIFDFCLFVAVVLLGGFVFLCVCVCVCACVRACVRVYGCVCFVVVVVFTFSFQIKIMEDES